MNGAIFFSGQYGSTAQYADWIGEANGLQVFNVDDANADPSKYDFLILGSSVIIHKLLICNWVKKNLTSIENKPIILFTVSGTSYGPKLDGWITDSLPADLILKMEHVALLAKLDHKEISWWTKFILTIGAWKNDDPKAKKEELEGFDFMDKSSIEPIQKLLKKFESNHEAS